MKPANWTRVIAYTLLPAILALAMPLSAAASEFLYLHNTYSSDISKISIPEYEVVATISIGHYIDDITPSPGEQILYVNRIETPGTCPESTKYLLTMETMWIS